MASLESLQTRALLKKGAVQQVANLTSYPVRLKYIGAGSVTSVVVTTGTAIVLTTVEGGTTYTQSYPFAAGLTYNTIGKLVDAINAGASTESATPATNPGILWEAKVMDGLRSHTTTSKVVGAPTTLAAKTILTGGGISEEVYDVAYDTTVAAPYVAVRLTYDRGFLKGQKKQHRVSLQEIEYLATLGSAIAGGLKVYEVEGTTETEVWSGTPVGTGTLTNKNFASGEGKITANDGNDLVVVMAGNGTVASTAVLAAIGEIE